MTTDYHGFADPFFPGSNFNADPVWENDDLANYAWINKIPSLADFIQKFIAEMNASDFDQDPDLLEVRFLQELNKQSWWADHKEAYRANAQAQIEDYTTWEGNLETHIGEIKRVAIQLGFPLDDNQAEALARESMQHGTYTVDELQREILGTSELGAWDRIAPRGRFREDPFTGGLFDSSKELGAGTVATQYDELLRLADENWITLTDGFKSKLREWARDIITGDMTLADAKSQIYTRASGGQIGSLVGEDRFRELETAGLTLEDEFADYRMQVSNIWEVPDQDVDTGWLKENLMVADDTGESRLANWHDIKAAAYGHSNYLKTKQYADRSAGATATLYKMFGAI